MGKELNFVPLDHFLCVAPDSPCDGGRESTGVSTDCSPSKAYSVASQMTKAGLIAENEAMRHRLEALENRQGKERRSNYLLRIFIDALPNFGFCLDAESRILQVLTGSQASEARALEGRLLAEVVPPEDARELGALLQETFDTGEVQDFDFVLSILAGRRWYRVKGSLVEEPDQDKKSAVLLFQDVTNEKLAEGVLKYARIELEQERVAAHEALVLSNELMLKAQEIGHFGSLEWNIVTDVQSWSNETYRIMGRDPDQFEANAQNFAEALHPGCKKRVLVAMANAVWKKKSFNLECRVLRPDGSERIVHAQGEVLRDETGNPQRMIGTVHDITERKQAEEELLRSQKLLQTVFDTIPNSLFVRDTNGKFLMVNKAMAARNGLEPNDFFDEEIWEIAPELKKNRAKYINHDKLVFETKTTVAGFEVSIVLPDGRTRIQKAIKEPLLDDRGCIVGVVGISEDITEQVQAEEIIRQSQSLLQTIFDTIPHALYVKDLEGRLLMVNKSWSDSFGIPTGKAMGTSLRDLPGPTEAEIKAFRASDESVLTSGEDFEISEQPITSVSGEVRFFHIRKSPYFDEKGKIKGLVGISVDITDRKRAEDSLRESEARYARAVAGTSDGIWDLNIETGENYFSPRWLQILGYADEDLEAVSESYYDLIHPDDRKIIAATVKAHFIEHATYDVEVRMRCKNGEYRWVRSKGLADRNSEGKPVRITGTISDITDRIAAENQLRDSRDQLQLVTDNLPVLISHIDTDERYIFVNKTAADWYGGRIEDIVGKTVRENFGDAEYGKMEPWINKVLSGEAVRFGMTVDFPNANQRDVEVAYIPEFGQNNQVRGFFVITADVTERHQLEEQLRQSQKMEALGTLAGGIAHDFNNILMPIIGYSQLLMGKSKSTSDDYSCANVIFQSGQRAKDLVSQILLFSRRGQTAKEVTDLRPLIEEVVKFARSTQPKTISISENITPESANVVCDASQIHQVLVNLCVNAGQAISGIGEIKIALETVQLDNFECIVGKVLSGPHVRIAVTDDGVGMDEETRSHIFEPFFTTRDVGKGTGLGLSTVFGIVQNHWGGIAISSEPDQGTTFEVFLPLAKGRVNKLPVNAARARNSGTEHILLVDDEEEITKLGKIFLERYGYSVAIAADGKTAFELFKASPERFHLVITDQSMPHMTGVTLAQELLKIRPGIPIILCTGHSESVTPETSKAMGISRFLYKPTALDELGRVVREVLDQAKDVSPLN